MAETARRRPSRHLDDQRIARAIEEAQAASTGRIVVAVAPHFWGDVRRAAERAFRHHRMHETADRNGVYIFVVPSRRTFVVLGDAAIHQRVGQSYWDTLRDATAERIKSNDLTDGIVHAIEDVGRQLAAHFPRRQSES